MAALTLATTGPAAGIVNIASPDFITVGQCAAMARRPILPVPLSAAGMIGNLVKRSGLADFSAEQLTFLAFGRGLDTERMRTDFGFEPENSTRATFQQYADHLRSVVRAPGGHDVVGSIARVGPDSGEGDLDSAGRVGAMVGRAADETAGALSRVYDRIQS